MVAELQIVNTLRSKRDKLEKAIEAARVALAHVNATLQLFETDAAPNAYPSKMSLIQVFRRGEIFAICKVVLSQAPDGMDPRELALAIIRSKGLNEGDAILRKAVACSINNVMQQQFRRGQIQHAGKRHGVRIWRLNEGQQ